MLALSCLGAIALWVLDTEPAPVVAAIDFDVDASGEFARAVDEITLLNMADEPGAVPEILPSTETELAVEVDGCNSPAWATLAVYPDPRWWLAMRAGRRGVSQQLAVRRGTNEPVAVPAGAVKGFGSASIPGEISNLKVFVYRGRDRIRIPATTEVLQGSPEIFTRVDFRVPDRAIENVVLRSVIGQTIFFTFDAPWVHPDGFRSCFVALPALVEGQAASLAGLGAEGLAIHSTTSASTRGPIRGTTKLLVANGEVAASSSRPPPRSSAVTPTWTCHRREEISEVVPPDCHASAVVHRPQREAWQQVLLLIFGAVSSAGFIGFLDGVRRIAVPFE